MTTNTEKEASCSESDLSGVVMCGCQDSTGEVCGRVMTKKEIDQDGMCWHCADNVWADMTSNELDEWKHSDRVDSNYT